MSSAFFETANRAMHEENQRLLAYTDALDKDPAARKAQIAEYKCAKYRYAAISNVHVRFLHSNRLKAKLTGTHYVLAPIEEALLLRSELLAEYEAAEDKPNAGLYLGFIAFTDQRIAECEDKLTRATDWEAIELTERIGGYRFARECLHDAWKVAEK
ncbi:MAG: hypothetical protein IJY12_00045 [Clostridia bacterium]|nr:hypothetical protein [Clostridia bacterium]